VAWQGGGAWLEGREGAWPPSTEKNKRSILLIRTVKDLKLPRGEQRHEEHPIMNAVEQEVTHLSSAQSRKRFGRRARFRLLKRKYYPV